MTNYNNLNIKYITLILILLFCSCTNKYIIKEEVVIELKNQLEDSMCLVIKTNIGQKQTYVKPYQMDSLSVVHSLMIEDDFYELSRNRIIHVEDYHVYNITDTCSIKLSTLDEPQQVFFINQIELHPIRVHSRFYTTKKETITLTPEFLHLFTKDYSMLEQFSEYYQEKRY